MDCKKWQQKLFNSTSIVEPFYILLTTLFTILLPLSFLFSSRLSTSNFVQTQHNSVSIVLFFHIVTILLYSLVSLISLFAILHALKIRNTLNSRSIEHIYKLPLYLSWFLVCASLVCVRIGLQENIAVNTKYLNCCNRISWIIRAAFFLGLHETTVYWSRMVVKPLVDDTLFGSHQEERWPEMVAAAAGYGGLWWFLFRGEFESLVTTIKVKKELMIGVSLGDYIGLFLYYLNVAIGIVTFVNLVFWFVNMYVNKSVKSSLDELICNDNDEKV